jgi:Hypothetical protein (DUF2513)
LKRGMDIAREILFTLEREQTSLNRVEKIIVAGAPDAEVTYYVALLQHAGFLIAHITYFRSGGPSYEVLRMTRAGHEFLDTIRSPEVWRKTKDTARKAGAASVELTWMIAKAHLKHIDEERTSTELDARDSAA